MGDGFRTFTTGEVVTAAQANGYWMEQVIAKFADATARDAAITSPEEGMCVYLADQDYPFRFYDGDSWEVFGPALDSSSRVLVEGITRQSDTTRSIRWGTGDPEGALTASIGSVFIRIDGSTNTVVYVKEAGTGNTGWSPYGTGTDRTFIAGFVNSTQNVSTNSQLYRGFGDVSYKGTQAPVVMPRAGSIVGISIAMRTARTGGSLTAEVFKNGTATGMTVAIDGTNTQYHYATQASGLDTFNAGDRIDVRATAASYTPNGSSDTFECSVLVQFS